MDSRIIFRFMGGVDMCDQKLTYYHIDRKAMKWYKKYFFHLLDVSISTGYQFCHTDDLHGLHTYLDVRLFG